ncbi:MULTISPECIES: acyclic terpene utilization AtuA family protein [Achromobacter]|jgi:hypothetical protein|uniref:Terpene utilization protein AtuA n=2 Tax=Achromobacter TaxID=222 RepID=E3HY23_ACHXA|nr:MULTISPECIES: acyclic terpene utilization AtuA family protein [Achromobacter]ADP19977.1 hypothetical protein AXYL_06693 [Achromobacter xylosoxidans A8]AVG44044.1 DUF1446 domain-containing protein [Achromobacter insolitus]CAB3849069.1 hypothetical protein LMG3410_01675 [Achromobacter aegrifaciens]CAB3911053.1 hypothetical protein LMG3415_04972 [Achromobacter mucicolens]
MNRNRTVRIGGASGFWGDSAMATPQLLEVPGLQYLVYDYLAETTMSIMSRARAKNPGAGYATDFVTAAMGPHLATILARGIKVVANAGGLNPHACAEALQQVAAEQGLHPKVAVLSGDDLMHAMPAWTEAGLADMHTGEAPPAGLMSANAYIGAQGIARALAWGADIVVTGRCVDSAVVLGPLVHEFGWSWTDWDRLASGTLAGHIVECGAQATGGLFTDWQSVQDWDRIGYPVIDCAEDGSFVVSKPADTGGLIHPGAVAEQILYEIGDPGAYLMPDVTCDFRDVRIEALDADHVRVSGVRGRAPGGQYKCNGTWLDGHQIALALAIRGIDAPEKARRTAQALLQRTRRMLAEHGYPDYTETSIELIGCEALYGPQAQPLPTREVLLRLAARHPDPKALRFLQRECASAGTSMAAGTRATLFGRADIQQVVKVFSFLVDKSEVPLAVTLGARRETMDVGAEIGDLPPAAPLAPAPAGGEAPGPRVQAPLVALAWARSGDKGDDENIGVIAREPRFLPLLREQLTPQAVREWFAHLVRGEVVRYEVPGIHALNFVMGQALGGGGAASLRSDPLGKSFAQMLLDFPLSVPAAWVQR